MIINEIIFREPGGIEVINSNLKMFKEYEFFQASFYCCLDVILHLSPGMMAEFCVNVAVYGCVYHGNRFSVIFCAARLPGKTLTKDNNI